MTRTKQSLQKVAMATAAVVALGLFAAPAQASSITWSFSFGTPNVHVSTSQNHGQVQNNNHRPRATHCMTNRQITRAMRDLGYRHVEYLRTDRRGRPVFTYIHRGWTYKSKVDRCSGKLTVVSKERVHAQHVRPSHGGGGHGGGNHASQGSISFKIN